MARGVEGLGTFFHNGWSKAAGGNASIVYVQVFLMSDKRDNIACVSNSKIQERTGLQENTISSCIKKCVSIGLMQKLPNQITSGKQKGTFYYLPVLVGTYPSTTAKIEVVSTAKFEVAKIEEGIKNCGSGVSNFEVVNEVGTAKFEVPLTTISLESLKTLNTLTPKTLKDSSESFAKRLQADSVPATLFEVETSEPKPKAVKKRKVGETTELQDACRETWNAYSDAFCKRYGTMPLSSARANTNIKTFVQTVGCGIAPAIASWFVSHQKRWYVESCHDVKCLSHDAHTLSTQYHSGRKVFTADAVERDRIGSQGAVWQRLLDKVERGEFDDKNTTG